MLKQNFEQTSFLQMQPLGCRAQVVTVFFGLVFLVRIGDLQASFPWAYVALLVAALGCVGSYKVSDSLHYWLTTAIVMAGCAACVGFVVNQLASPQFWFLPAGLCMTLPAAALYLSPRRYLAATSVVWLALIAVVQPSFPIFHGAEIAALAVISSTAIGTLANRSIQRLRRSNFEMQQDLHHLAHVDPLTELPNRRSFMTQLQSAMESAKPDKALYFLMLDIDDFKKINDSFGHDVGDDALVEVAKIIRTEAAEYNFARLGGEEFAVVAACESVADLNALAHRLVLQTSSCQVQGRGLTLSIGVARYVAGEGATGLMRRADDALYQAKRDGKNRYVMAGGGVSAS